MKLSPHVPVTIFWKLHIELLRQGCWRKRKTLTVPVLNVTVLHEQQPWQQ